MVQINIPPQAIEGQIYMVKASEKCQYITMEIFSNGQLMLIAQKDNTDSVSILLKRYNFSLKGKARVVVGFADSKGIEGTARTDIEIK